MEIVMLTENHRPLLSIVIATYRRSACLEHMLVSILQQIPDVSGGSVEIVVVDNGLDDETLHLMENLQTRHREVKYFRRPFSVPMEESILSAREYGSGRYLWALGDDDALEPGALRLVLDHIQAFSPQLFLVHHDAWAPDMARLIGTMHNNLKEKTISYPSLLRAVHELGWGVYFAYLGSCIFLSDRFRAVNAKPYLNSAHSFSFCLLDAFHDEPCTYINVPAIRYRTSNILPYSIDGLKAVTTVLLQGFLHLIGKEVGSWKMFLGTKDIIASGHKLLYLKIHTLAACMLSNQWDRLKEGQPIAPEEWGLFDHAYGSYGNNDMIALLRLLKDYDGGNIGSKDEILRLLGVVLIKENLDTKSFPRDFLLAAP